MRRRRRTQSDQQQEPGPTFEDLPELDTFCETCLEAGHREAQRESPGGATCRYGHGGASGVTYTEMLRRSREKEPLSQQADRDQAEFYAKEEAAFLARDGDTLTVKYEGANLQIAPYSMVQIDSAIFTRHLQAGEDPVEEYEKIRAFLARRCEAYAREKLKLYADELRKAKERAGGRR